MVAENLQRAPAPRKRYVWSNSVVLLVDSVGTLYSTCSSSDVSDCGLGLGFGALDANAQ